MKKKLLLIFAVMFSSTFAFASNDIFRYDNLNLNNAMLNNRFNHMSNSLNPYAENSYNPFTKILRPKNNTVNRGYYPAYSDRYSKKNINDSDYEYLLSKMEKNRFNQVYSDSDIDTRLDRLDSIMFGAIQSGDYKIRLNRLKHAFSAQSTRGYKAKKQKLNSFKEMFSSGSPTSIPVGDDYYSSLDNSFSAW